MRINEAVTRGRALAESLMQDRVRVWRESSDAPVVDEWGSVSPAPAALVYGDPVLGGPAKAQNDRTYPAQPDIAASAQILAMVSHVHFPHGTTEVRSGDVVEWVSSVNPRLVGRMVRVTVDQDKTWNTAARFNVSEVVV